MWKKIFLYCIGVGIVATASAEESKTKESKADVNQTTKQTTKNEINANQTADKTKEVKYALLAPESHDIIGYLIERVQKYAESQPSVNAQNIYDYIKSLRLEMKTKKEINACNFMMSYFRLQSNDQSGNVIRKKLADLSEAMLWLERKKNNRLSANYLTDFRIVSFLVSDEVFPHLTANNMKLVLNEVKKYKDEASQRAALNALTAEGGTLLPQILNEKQINDAQLVYEHFQNIINQVGAAITKDTDVEGEVIRLQNQLNTLKRDEFDVDGKKYKYTRNMRKQLEYSISNKIAALILYRNNDNVGK